MASAVKCAWKVTTVSHSYLDELKESANGLENLFQYEVGKSSGILNGIDTHVWDPETDSMIIKNYSKELVEKGKKKNKKNWPVSLVWIRISRLSLSSEDW